MRSQSSKTTVSGTQAAQPSPTCRILLGFLHPPLKGWRAPQPPPVRSSSGEQYCFFASTTLSMRPEQLAYHQKLHQPIYFEASTAGYGSASSSSHAEAQTLQDVDEPMRIRSCLLQMSAQDLAGSQRVDVCPCVGAASSCCMPTYVPDATSQLS